MESVGRGGFGLVGDYTLKVDFTRTEMDLATIISGTLTNAQKQDYITLFVPESKAFHFALDSFTSNPAVD